MSVQPVTARLPPLSGQPDGHPGLDVFAPHPTSVGHRRPPVPAWSSPLRLLKATGAWLTGKGQHRAAVVPDQAEADVQVVETRAVPADLRGLAVAPDREMLPIVLRTLARDPDGALASGAIMGISRWLGGMTSDQRSELLDICCRMRPGPSRENNLRLLRRWAGSIEDVVAYVDFTEAVDDLLDRGAMPPVTS